MSIVPGQGNIATHAADGNMLQDVMVLLRAIVKFEENSVLQHLEFGDHHAVAWLGGDSILLQLLGVAISGGTEGSVGVEHNAFSTQRKRADGEGLVRLKGAD